jgi:hypothetical protein
MECYKSGELTPYEAYLASRWLGLERVLVSHYVDPGCADVEQFLSIAGAVSEGHGPGPEITVLQPGEVAEL